MLWPELVQGSLIQRENRFRALVSLAGAEVSAHVANSGRLRELMVPGRAVWLTPVAGAGPYARLDSSREGHIISAIDSRRGGIRQWPAWRAEQPV